MAADTESNNRIKKQQSKIIMKKQHLLALVLGMAGLAVGCNKSSNNPDDNSATTNSSMSVTQEVQNIKEDSSNAWEATKEGASNAWASVKLSLQSSANYSYDKKDAFVTDAQADLAVLDQKIKDLSDKVAASSDSVKADAQAKLQDLQTQRAALDKKLDDAKNSSEADWDSTKTAFINSYNDTKNSLKQDWQWLKDKMSQ
jgi:hypothetical protein